MANLNQEDLQKVMSKIDDVIKEIEEIWIDRDYSSELDDRDTLIDLIKKEKDFIRRYFKPY